MSIRHRQRVPPTDDWQQLTLRLDTPGQQSGRSDTVVRSRAAGLAMVYKLAESAQARWWAVNGPNLAALICAGAVFRKGVLIENNPTEDQVTA